LREVPGVGGRVGLQQLRGRAGFLRELGDVPLALVVQVHHRFHRRRIRGLVVADVGGGGPELTAGGSEGVGVLQVALDDAALAAHVPHLGEFFASCFFFGDREDVFKG